MNELAPITPPHSLEMEQAVLRQAVADRVAALKLSTLLEESDFHLTAHKRIFAALRTVAQTAEPCPILALPAELKRRGHFEEVGADYLVDTIGSGYYQGAAELTHYAERVAEAGTLRWLAEICTAAAAKCVSQTATSEEIKGALIAAVVSRGRKHTRGPVLFGDALVTELTRIVEHRPVEALQFGIAALDRFCGGLERGEVGILAGKPGTGKTALLHQAADHASTHWGAGLIFSLEVNEAAITRRQLARVTGFSYRELRTLKLWREGSGYVRMNDADKNFIASCADSLGNLSQRLWIDSSTCGLDQLIARAHELHAEHPLSWLAIDYGQLVEVRNAKSRNVEVEAVTRAAKNQLATTLRVPVIMVSSLSKAGMGTKGAEMNDLAESASLQYTAGLILYLLDDPEYSGAGGVTGVKASVLKCRNDQSGEVPLCFHKARFMLTDRDGFQAPPPEDFPTYGEDDPFVDERGIR